MALEPKEMWADVGELTHDVFEHSRLMTTMNRVVASGVRSEENVRKIELKDIWDLTVLRTVRMM